MSSVRSVMATKSVRPALTPKQAITAATVLAEMAFTHEGDAASRLYSASAAIRSALYEDGWEMDDNGTWRKEVKE